MNELNHRVKNKLMMINALIRLKNESLGDEVDLSDFLHQIDTILFCRQACEGRELGYPWFETD